MKKLWMKFYFEEDTDKDKHLHVSYRFRLSYSKTANDLFGYLRREIFLNLFRIKVESNKFVN